jgi:DNA-binding MarR family transcriptional regulator
MLMEVDKISLGLKLGETLKVIVKKFSSELPKVGGITLEQFFLLTILNKNDELIQQDLAHLMNRDKSGVLRLINALEEKKLVVRRPDATDRRKKNLALTEKGSEVLGQCMVKEAEIYEKILEGIDDQSLEVFSEALSRIQMNAKHQ